ncbi:MAG: hypothetical protein N2C14_32920 [Planctomycetales bacterium]
MPINPFQSPKSQSGKPTGDARRELSCFEVVIVLLIALVGFVFVIAVIVFGASTVCMSIMDFVQTIMDFATGP